MSKKYPAVLLAALGATAPLLALADTTYEAHAGAGYSDNLLRSATATEGGNILVAGVGIDSTWDAKRLKGLLQADLTAQNYDSALLGDEIIGQAKTDLSLALVPERFNWAVTDTFGQVATDPLQPVTSRNRGNVNVFSTGPDLRLRLGDATAFTLGGRYNDVSFARANTDYDGWTAMAAVVRQLSSLSSVSLAASRERVDYDLAALPSYDLDQVYVQYLATGVRTTLDLSAGTSRIRRDVGSEQEPLLRLNITRKLTPRSTLTLGLQRGLLTGGEVFRNLSDLAPGTVSQGAVGDSALQSLYSATWKTTWTQTTLQLDAVYGKDDFSTANTRDVERRTFGVRLDRQFTPRFSGSVGVRYDNRDYYSLAREQDDTQFVASLEHRLTEAWSAVLEYQSSGRDDTLPAGQYDENIVFLTLRWAPRRAAAP